ncbi:amino acid/amide ABC transporter ATP-binding protein 1, HAAT family [Micromonospora viridifaciens]|uniref:Amino acid/amide ABC transporter ATP-binding protein 1, HAAT family n=1 Tax=Micromonospora viridifaciens TaxID=1881 RepID=A0A1C4YVP7_MICVI|nr:ABC transporter ATP-binding protein [Micromonospora viridifaciens]SCF24687.1 amino acid/amide ABC transporter ATP-binding protein 1, HAAT family [Micromonospora viridifaciens]
MTDLRQPLAPRQQNPAAGGPPELELSGVSVRFGGVNAVSQVSFSVTRGSIHALIGPNGAGKSSCFNAITGVYRLAEGRVAHRGERIDQLRAARIARRGIARTFQNLVLPESLTVAECMRVARHHRTHAGFLATGLGLPRARREERSDRAVIERSAEMAGVVDILDERVGPLPYGVRKRVEFARALCAEPSVLMLDEPVAGINDTESAQMAHAVRRARDEADLTVLLVEHDMNFVMTLADRITVLQSGQVIADAAPEEVRADPAVIAAYLGDDVEEAARD